MNQLNIFDLYLVIIEMINEKTEVHMRSTYAENPNTRIIYDNVQDDPLNIIESYKNAKFKNASEMEIDDNEKMLLAKKPRFDNNVGIIDNQFPEYNMNSITYSNGRNHFIGEGPAWKPDNKNRNQALRYFQAIASSNVDHVIVAGSPYDRERSGFLDYFGPSPPAAVVNFPDSPGFKLSSTPNPENKQEDFIKKYNLELTVQVVNKYGQPEMLTKKFEIQHITDWPDFGIPKFSDNDIRILLANKDTSQNLAIHCGAGKGRTGALELAYYLFDNQNEVFSQGGYLPDIKVVEKYLDQLRSIRPGLIQDSNQLQVAIELAAQMKYANENINKPIDRVQIAEQVNSAINNRAAEISQPQQTQAAASVGQPRQQSVQDNYVQQRNTIPSNPVADPIQPDQTGVSQPSSFNLANAEIAKLKNISGLYDISIVKNINEQPEILIRNKYNEKETRFNFSSFRKNFYLYADQGEGIIKKVVTTEDFLKFMKRQNSLDSKVKTLLEAVRADFRNSSGNERAENLLLLKDIGDLFKDIAIVDIQSNSEIAFKDIEKKIVNLEEKYELAKLTRSMSGPIVAKQNQKIAKENIQPKPVMPHQRHPQQSITFSPVAKLHQVLDQISASIKNVENNPQFSKLPKLIYEIRNQLTLINQSPGKDQKRIIESFRKNLIKLSKYSNITEIANDVLKHLSGGKSGITVKMPTVKELEKNIKNYNEMLQKAMKLPANALKAQFIQNLIIDARHTIDLVSTGLKNANNPQAAEYKKAITTLSGISDNALALLKSQSSTQKIHTSNFKSQNIK